jgi:ABC-type phosphate transport system ATPase subunit
MNRPSHLGPDQRKALAHVVTSPDRFTGFRGLAGTGKSTVLVELNRMLDDEGFEALFCAPTAAAADTLRKDKLEAVTLAKIAGGLGHAANTFRPQRDCSG